MKVPLAKLAKLIGESVDSLEGLQGSVLPDGVEVELETSVLAYCNWLRSGGKAKQSVEIEYRKEQLAKLRAERRLAESKASGTGTTLSEAATVLGVKTDTLKKWHGLGCPGAKDGLVWSFDIAKVFAWRIEREKILCSPKEIAPKDGTYDADYERARKDKEMADKLALANSRARGELVEIAAVKKLGEKVMVAIRNRLLNMPLTDEEKDRCLLELLALDRIDWTRDA